MLSILSGMLVIITVTNAENQLYSDICASVLKTNISSRVATVQCYSDSITFDPNSQKGLLLLNDTGSWTAEIFTCQCSCSLPNDPKYGWILTKDRIQHGKSLEYNCDAEKKIKRKIICFDGLLMLVPDFLENLNISIAFRQKSITKQFCNNFQNAIFQLSVNETSDWSVLVKEVSNNQKYIHILAENETLLKYYLFNGEGFKIGTIELNKGLELECIKTVESGLPTVIIIVIVLVVIFAVIVSVILVIIYCFREQIRKCWGWPSRTNDPVPMMKSYEAPSERDTKI